MSEFVSYSQEDGIATLTMDDGKANAFGPAMIAALGEGLDQAEREAKVVIVTGRPGVFCAGFDLNIIRGDDEAAKQAMRSAGEELVLRIYLHPQPVILASSGHALAAGALLLLSGDYRLGAEGDFKTGLNEVTIGLPLPPFGLELARDRLSKAALTQATLTSRIYDPEGAVEAGYLDATAAPDALAATAENLARQMLALDGAAFAATKERLRRQTLDRIREGVARL